MNDFNSLNMLPEVDLFHHFGGEYTSVQSFVPVEITPLPYGWQREMTDPRVRDM